MVVVVLENRVLPLLLMWRPSTVVDAATTIAGFNLVLALFFLPWQKQQKEHCKKWLKQKTLNNLLTK